MPKNNLAKLLDSISAGTVKRSKIGRLREVLPDVEKALSLGVSQEAIRESLAADGLVVSRGTFSWALSRLRAETTPTPSSTPAPPALTRPATPSKSHPTPTTPPSVSSAKTTAPKASATPVEPDPAMESDDSSSTPSTDPRDLDRIIGSTPDLAALARLAPRGKKIPKP